MSRTGKSRVLGSSAVIFLMDESNTLCPIGEVDKFSAKENGDLKKSRPLGKKEFASQYDFQGYELSFEGGKVDWKLAALMQAQAVQFLGGGRTPYFTVKQKVVFYDSTVEEYIYNDVTIYGFNFDAGGSGDELGEKFEGFSSSRTAAAGKAQDAVTEAFTSIRNSLSKMASQSPDGNGTLYDATTSPIGALEQ